MAISTFCKQSKAKHSYYGIEKFNGSNINNASLRQNHSDNIYIREISVRSIHSFDIVVERISANKFTQFQCVFVLKIELNIFFCFHHFQ